MLPAVAAERPPTPSPEAGTLLTPVLCIMRAPRSHHLGLHQSPGPSGDRHMSLLPACFPTMKHSFPMSQGSGNVWEELGRDRASRGSAFIPGWQKQLLIKNQPSHVRVCMFACVYGRGCIGR